MQVYKLRLTLGWIWVSLLFVSNIQAQNIEITGKVVDAENNQPVEFANLGVIGTYLGTASDFNGDFSLSVGEEFADFKVQISAVGYRPKELSVNELLLLTPVTVKLLPQAYGIGQVDVKAESKRLYGIVKSASNMISDNYLKSYSAKVYFEQNNKTSQKTEAALLFSDAKGYGERSYSAAFENRNYKIEEVRRNFDVIPLESGLLHVQDILDFDIVRVRGNVLDVNMVDQFKLDLKDEIVMNGDSVWVIAFEMEKPDMVSTGDARIKSYKGLLYVNQKDQAIIRAEINAVSNGYFHAGRSAYKESEDSQLYEYNVGVDYRKFEAGYALSKIQYSALGSSGEAANKSEIKWIVYDVHSKSSVSGNTRQYFVDKESDPDFWKRFSVPE